MPTLRKTSTKSKKKVVVDWNNEDSVLAAMAIALDVDAQDLSIDEDRGLGGFGEGTFYTVALGSKEYQVAENQDAAHSLAVAIVKQDLKESPENFSHDFIQNHIDLEKQPAIYLKGNDNVDTSQ